MKFFRLLLVTMAAIAVLVTSVMAEEEISPKQLEKKFSMSVLIKNDFYQPTNGRPGFFENGVVIYGHHKLDGDYGIGAGIDTWGGKNENFWLVRPFVTVNKGPYYLICGYNADTFGAGHVFTGFWYVKQINRFDIFLDARYYVGVRKQASDFLDVFGSVTHPIGQSRFYAGLEGEIIKWWGQNKDHSWSFIAPVVGFKLTKQVKLFVRPGISWDRTCKGTDQAFYLRTGLVYEF
jgi:hypothetical protein